MRELTRYEMSLAGGGVEPVTATVAVVLAAAGVYGAAKSIYEFGKALGSLIVTSDEPTADVSN